MQPPDSSSSCANGVAKMLLLCLTPCFAACRASLGQIGMRGLCKQIAFPLLHVALRRLPLKMSASARSFQHRFQPLFRLFCMHVHIRVDTAEVLSAAFASLACRATAQLLQVSPNTCPLHLRRGYSVHHAPAALLNRVKSVCSACVSLCLFCKSSHLCRTLREYKSRRGTQFTVHWWVFKSSIPETSPWFKRSGARIVLWVSLGL